MAISKGTFKVPSTKNQLVSQANRIGRAIENGEWSRAAMVFAWTEPGQAGRPKTQKNSGDVTQISTKISFSDFAALGIFGLKTRKTVAQYWHAWDNARQDGAVTDVVVGEEVSLPDEDEADWKLYYDSGARSADKTEAVTETPADQDVSETSDESVDTATEDDVDQSTAGLDQGLAQVAQITKQIGRLAASVTDTSFETADSERLATEIQKLINALEALKTGVTSGTWDEQLESLS
jgi:hypothetical protein